MHTDRSGFQAIFSVLYCGPQAVCLVHLGLLHCVLTQQQLREFVDSQNGNFIEKSDAFEEKSLEDATRELSDKKRLLHNVQRNLDGREILLERTQQRYEDEQEPHDTETLERLEKRLAKDSDDKAAGVQIAAIKSRSTRRKISLTKIEFDAPGDVVAVYVPKEND